MQKINWTWLWERAKKWRKWFCLHLQLIGLSVLISQETSTQPLDQTEESARNLKSYFDRADAIHKKLAQLRQ